MERVEYLGPIEEPSASKRAVTLNYAAQLPSGVTISSCTVTALDMYANTSASILASSTATLTDSNTKASVRVQNATAGKKYKLTFTAVLSDGQQWVDYVQYNVKDI